MAIFTDNFNRANENPLASPWQSVNAAGSLSGKGLKVDANQLVGNSGTNASILTGLEFLDDQSAKVTIAATDTFCPAGVIVRGDVNGNGYLLYYNKNGDDVRLGTLVNGTFTNLKFFGDVGFVEGSSLGLSVSGNTLTAFINGVQLGTPYEDTSYTYTSGVTGVWYENGNGNLTKLDNFSSEGWNDIAILNVDSDDVIEDGQQDIPFTTRSFSGDITTVSITSGAYSAPLTGLAGTGTSYTVDLFDVSSFSSDTAGIPFTSANHVNLFEASDGTDTATLEITRNPKAGWAVIDTVGAVATQGSVFENRAGGAMSDNSQVLYPTASNTTISPDGTITTDAATVEGKAWDVDTGAWEIFTVNFGTGLSLPVVEAGNNIAASNGDTVNLSDAAASDYDSLSWTCTSGQSPTFSDTTILNPTVTFNETGTHILELTATNADGSSSDTLTATVEAVDGNLPPEVNAGPDQTVKSGEFVQLDASFSTDPEDGDVAQFGWEQISGPLVSLSAANTAKPYFTAPSSLDQQELVFRVFGQDSDGATSNDTVKVTVTPIESNAMLDILETLDFALETNGSLVAFKGRANREVIQLKPSSTSGIVTQGGYLDVSKNDIRKVEIITNGDKLTNVNSDSIKIDGTRILARLGDLDLDVAPGSSSSPSFTIVLYVGEDTKGLVVASSVSQGYKNLSYRVELSDVA